MRDCTCGHGWERHDFESVPQLCLVCGDRAGCSDHPTWDPAGSEDAGLVLVHVDLDFDADPHPGIFSAITGALAGVVHFAHIKGTTVCVTVAWPDDPAALVDLLTDALPNTRVTATEKEIR